MQKPYMSCRPIKCLFFVGILVVVVLCGCFKRNIASVNEPQPQLSSLAISEIMYAPKSKLYEFVEITNISGADINLYDSVNQNRWKISGGIHAVFPKGSSIKNNEKILIVSDSVTDSHFRTYYNVDTNVKIFFYSKKLSNTGDTIILSKPDKQSFDSASATITVSYVIVEKIAYSNTSPWPQGAEKTGNSLQRIDLGKSGNDPTNWKVAAPTPGQ